MNKNNLPTLTRTHSSALSNYRKTPQQAYDAICERARWVTPGSDYETTACWADIDRYYKETTNNEAPL